MIPTKETSSALGGDLANKISEELVPSYFFIGFLLGSQYKTFEEMEKALKYQECFEWIKDYYKKGEAIVLAKTSEKICPKCKKILGNKEGMTFCLFCGEKLIQ